MAHKLVYGLGGGLIYSCGGNGAWVDIVPKLLKSFDNQVLISTVDMSAKAAKVIYDAVGQDRLYLDSGGFTLYKRQVKLGADNPAFHEECEKMKRKFLKMLTIVKCDEVFELDNEYFRADEDLMSPKNYCREEVKALTGFYPTPVFKMHQGFEYWKRLCDSDMYPKLAIGGLAQTMEWNTHWDELIRMMNYARDKGKKVHLLGCQNAEAFRMIHPDTVDYSIFQFWQGMKYVNEHYPHLKEYSDKKQQLALFAFARAKSRSFLYDNDCKVLHEGEDHREDEGDGVED